jgi:Leucine-rich repeat (LRR) protein
METLIAVYVCALVFFASTTSTVTTCPAACVCSSSSSSSSSSNGGRESQVSCEGAGLTAIPSSADMPPTVASFDVSHNSRLGPRLGRDSIDRLERLLAPNGLVELKLRGCDLEDIDGVFGPYENNTSDSGSWASAAVGADEADGVEQSSSSLQTLDLSGNRIVRLGAGAFRRVADRLLNLDLSDNALAEIGTGTFAGLRSLARLELRHNRLTAIAASTFAGLGSGLRHLRLDDNEITAIDVDSFAGLDRLTYLVMRGNPLGTPGSVASDSHQAHRSQNSSRSRHSNHHHHHQQQQQQQQHVIRFKFHSPILSYIDLSECHLTRVPRGLPRRSLRYLQLRRNRISAISKSDIDDCCPNAAVLILDENRLEQLIDSPFADRPHLRQLWLAGNRLQSVPGPIPPGLERLFLDSNVIERLEADDFVIGSRLQTLSVASNRLGPKLNPDALSRLGELRMLDLSDNELRTIGRATFAGSRRLESLSLAKNPLDGGEIEDGAFDGLGRLETLIMSHLRPSAADGSRPAARIGTEAFRGLRDGRLRKLDLDGSR